MEGDITLILYIWYDCMNMREYILEISLKTYDLYAVFELLLESSHRAFSLKKNCQRNLDAVARRRCSWRAANVL